MIDQGLDSYISGDEGVHRGETFRKCWKVLMEALELCRVHIKETDDERLRSIAHIEYGQPRRKNGDVFARGVYAMSPEQAKTWLFNISPVANLKEGVIKLKTAEQINSELLVRINHYIENNPIFENSVQARKDLDADEDLLA